MLKIICLVGLITTILTQKEQNSCKPYVFGYLNSYNQELFPQAVLCTLSDPSHDNNYLYGILALNTENNLQEGFKYIRNAYDNGLLYSSIYFINFLSHVKFRTITDKAFKLEGITTLKMFYEDKHLKDSVQLLLTLTLKILNEGENSNNLTNKKKYMLLNIESPKKSLDEWLKSEEQSKYENKLNSRAIKYHKINARAGNQTSNFFLGHIYHQGQLGLQPDTERAMEHYNNSPDILGVHNNMAQLLFESGDEGDIETALQLLEEGAEAGDSYSLLNLGLIYIQGKHGKKKDEKKGIELLEKAAKLDLEEANYVLGAYLKENPKLDTAKKSFDFLEKAADKGHARARISLAQSELLMGSYNKGLKRVSGMLENIQDTWIFKDRIHNSLKQGNYHAALFNSIVLAELSIKSGMVNAIGLALIMHDEILKGNSKFSGDKDFNMEVLDTIITRYLTILSKTDIKYLTILGNYHYKKRDYTQAVKYYENAAKYKDKWGSAILASMFLVGNKVERDWDRANYYANNLSYTEKDFANILLKIVVNSAVRIKGFFSYIGMDDYEL